MNATETRARVEALVRRLHGAGDKEPLSEDLVLLGQDGIFDSVMALQLVVGIEEEFGIVIEDKDIHSKHFKDLNSITHYIQSKSADRKVR